MTRATVIIAAATVINVIVSLYMGNKTREYTEITNKIYKASSRPYVGINTIKISKNEPGTLTIALEFKNFGNTPATNVRISFDALLNNGKMNESHRYKNLDKMHSNIFPQCTYSFPFSVTSNYKEITSGVVPFVLNIKANYSSITEDNYEDNEEMQYNPFTNSFFPIAAKTR